MFYCMTPFHLCIKKMQASSDIHVKLINPSNFPLLWVIKMSGKPLIKNLGRLNVDPFVYVFLQD